MKTSQRAYIAGLLDGDGCIMLQLHERHDFRFLFRPKTIVILYQDSRHHDDILFLQSLIGGGYVYKRNDHITEFRLEGHEKVRELLLKLQPYVLFKHKQVEYMLEAIKILQKKKYQVFEFLRVCELSDLIAQQNYSSKHRKYTASYIRQRLHENGLIPVTTGVSK